MIKNEDVILSSAKKIRFRKCHVNSEYVRHRYTDVKEIEEYDRCPKVTQR